MGKGKIWTNERIYGEGIVTIFKNFFLTFTLSTFELIFAGGVSHPVLAVIYQPSNCNSKVINDFCDIFSIMKKCDRTLIIGDFNIHVYCTPKSLAADFLDLVNVFSLHVVMVKTTCLSSN